MSDLNMSVGSTIKERREALNIKQDDLAKQVGVTVQTMSKWERDITEPKASQVNKLSKTLKISEHDICKGESSQKEEMDPLEFAKDVGRLISEIPHVELLMNIYDYVDDKEGFLKELYDATDDKFKWLSEAHEDMHKKHVENELAMINKGNITFSNDEFKQKYIDELNYKLTKTNKPKWME